MTSPTDKPHEAAMQELKPCPFCGLKANCRPLTFPSNDWVAECNNIDCGVEITTCAYPTREAALKRWNRRANTGDGN